MYNSKKLKVIFCVQGVISPLLANVYLTALDERYYRWTFAPNEPPLRALGRRRCCRRYGKPIFFIVRYADDFVILTDGTQADAEAEKKALETFLKETLRMELSVEKTLVTKVEDGFDFLGYQVIKETAKLTGKSVGKLRIPKEKKQLFRDKIKGMMRPRYFNLNLEAQIYRLNPVIRGWRNYYQYAAGACKDFSQLDWWIWHRVRRWLRRKHKRMSHHKIRRRYARKLRPTRWTWGEGKATLQLMADGGTRRYKFRGTKISNGWNGQDDRLASEEAKANAELLNALR